MSHSPILLLHIASGTLGMFSGFVTVFLRKGSRRHGLAGNVFVVSMMSLGATGVCMATLKHQPGNILGGTFTFYLVTTAWLTARRGDASQALARRKSRRDRHRQGGAEYGAARDRDRRRPSGR